MFYDAQQNLTGLKSFTVLGRAFQGSIKLYGSQQSFNNTVIQGLLILFPYLGSYICWFCEKSSFIVDLG